MIPTGASINTQNTQPIEQPSQTWRLDFNRGRVTGTIDGLDAVRQAVSKIVQTERFRYLIYDADYGIELDGLIGWDPVFVQSELRRRITEALTQDDRVYSVTDYQIDIAGDTATVRFTVVSSFGSFQEEVTTRV
ncbi:hypothetical protein PACILC2_22140 [Paenibacillus cisolokensis]|uniref:Phage portal protein n=1 Tax=Paenibacillus cisolokensis TaxID=1658519 RepID=A0ABQ4N6W7_9BACL|nr:DUF2634 domain-containing protein [Paenibacillus cisolokensis]GIQ63646.1 hypothetical protein PACILC2_22140 [Paenibacillus cisolokensis]